MMTPLLETRRLSKQFGGLLALDELSFQVQRGEILGIVGHNGAGKSTLFHLITGFLRPTSGEILFEGHPVTAWPPYRRVRRGLAPTFQQTRLFYGLTVEENVRLGCFTQQRGGLRRFLLGTPHRERLTMQRRVNEILALTGLERFRAQPASQLSSYGYQRRLEVAIALGSGPKLLLLDEPFGGLSPSGIEEMGQLIQTLHDAGLTIMFIEHRMKSIWSYCSRLFVMSGGRLLIPQPAREALHASR